MDMTVRLLLAVLASQLVVACAALPRGAQAMDEAPACDTVSVRPKGKVKRLYWAIGPDNRPVHGSVDHQVDLNLVVRTAGYEPGDCIEATVHSDDGEDVAVGVHTLVLRGRVDQNGAALFRAPLKDLTLQH
jgi:hypothetical protein